MGYTIADLRKKILEFHPEIEKNGLNLSLSLDEGNQRYSVKLGKGGEEVGAYLEKQDADECMAGKKCVKLAVLVTQLTAELEEIMAPRKPG